MGFWSKLFSSEMEYPPLDASNPAAGYIDEMKADIESIADQVQDPMEVVPDQGEAYIFVGKPPKKFGVFWVEHGKVGNLKKMADERGLTEEQMMNLSEHLRRAYINSQAEMRYSTDMAKGKMTVTPSSKLLSDVKKIIQMNT